MIRDSGLGNPVSIHAPAREATTHMYRVPPREIVSIHAPAREATFAADKLRGPHRVSIHAPAREATITGREMVAWTKVSIHAPAREATFFANSRAMALAFRSTPPRGRRPDSPGRYRGSSQFRSTPPRGRRPADRWTASVPRAVSIHAPAREATWGRACWLMARRCFDPRPRAGGDVEHLFADSALGVFRSTPPRGRRPVRSIAIW